MKKEILKMLALLLFGAAALSGCAIDSGRYHNRYNNDRNHDRDHNNRHDGYRGHDNNQGGYNHSNY